MINFLSWNVRGAGAQSFPGLIRDMMVRYKVGFLALFEPRISGSIAINVIQKFKFMKNYHVDARGFSGGIWILWNEDNFEVEVIEAQAQAVYMVPLIRFRGRSYGQTYLRFQLVYRSHGCL